MFVAFADGSRFASAVSAVAADMSLLEFLIPRDQSLDEGYVPISSIYLDLNMLTYALLLAEQSSWP